MLVHKKKKEKVVKLKMERKHFPTCIPTSPAPGASSTHKKST